MKTFLLLLALLGAVARAATSSEDPAHLELRGVRDGFLAAVNRGDVEGELAFLHPNVVVTWHSAEVSRGREGVRTWLEHLLHSPEKAVEASTVQVKVDELSILHGSTTAIAFGSAQEHYTLAGGRHLYLAGRWSATMVKENGQWLIASLHESDNLFDNPPLNRIKAILPWVGGASLALGILFGWYFSRKFRSN